MLHDGRIGTDSFLRLQWAPKEQALMPSLVTSESIIVFFSEYQPVQVKHLRITCYTFSKKSPVAARVTN